MVKLNLKLLEKLINTYGVSGSEGEVRGIISEELKKYADSVKVDKMGNLVVRQKGAKPVVMLAAHMDEVGLMVKNISDTGYIYCSVIGGIDPITLIGQKVHLVTKKGKIHGVITTRNISQEHDVEELPKLRDIIVDTGLGLEELKKLGVEIGYYVSLEQKAGRLGKRDIIFGKSLDDRLGCFILVELAKRVRKNKNEIVYVFTVQEELGLYGAKTSAYKVEPDWAIAVDVTNADDASEHPTRRMGKGPCITIKDASMLGNKCINDWIRVAAKKRKIPLQLDVSDLGATDALSISLSKGGVPSAVVGVAVRNLHTTMGMASLKDIERAIDLLCELLKKSPKVCFV